MSGVPAFALAEAATFVLVAARVAGMVVTSPFPGKHVPNRAKVGLVLMLALIARAAQPAVPGLTIDLALAGLVPGELGIGIVVGFTVRVTFAVAEVLGASLAQGTGLTFGQVYDPTLGSEDTVPSRIVTLFAMLLFFGIGAHRVALAYTLESFRALPVGHAVTIGAAAPSMVDFVTSATEVGVRLALPVIAVALAVQLALALVARAAPSLQVFSIGMAITVAAGLLAILGSVDDVSSGLASALLDHGAGGRLERVLTDIASGGRRP